MSDQKLARAYDEAMEQIVHLEAEIERLRADNAELLAALEKSVELQSHYASLLNQYDAGTRILFNSVGAWMDRLRAIAKAESK